MEIMKKRHIIKKVKIKQQVMTELQVLILVPVKLIFKYCGLVLDTFILKVIFLRDNVRK